MTNSTAKYGDESRLFAVIDTIGLVILTPRHISFHRSKTPAGIAAYRRSVSETESLFSNYCHISTLVTTSC